MQLGDVLEMLTLDSQLGGLEVDRVEIDSRECAPGTLFFALPGASYDGADFIEDAAQRGAVAAVASRLIVSSIPVVVVPERSCAVAWRLRVLQSWAIPNKESSSWE